MNNSCFHIIIVKAK